MELLRLQDSVIANAEPIPIVGPGEPPLTYEIEGTWEQGTPLIVTNIVYVYRYLPPSNTTIRVYFKDKLTEEPLYHMEFVTPRRAAFAGWEVIEE